MAHWAAEWGLELVQREKFEVAWDCLHSELSDAVEELQRVFKSHGSKQGIAITSGSESLEIRDSRNRKLCFTLDKSGSVIRITPSWMTNTEYRFRISDASGKIASEGPLFPGMKPQVNLKVEAYVQAKIKALTA